jgi:hypothetical protein
MLGVKGNEKGDWLAGVKENECADRHAETAVISDGHAMDHADVLHAFCEVKSEDLLGVGDSNIIERLRDGQEKLGIAKYEHSAGTQRQVNQKRTGTVSCHTPFNVLKRR